MDTGHWLLSAVEYPENPYGFIYCITNKMNGKKYIGKKQIVKKVKKMPLKGKKNKRISFKESDWKTYTGSSTDLNGDIEKFGKDNFIFEIIKFCFSKWEMSYSEIKEQIRRDVLLSEGYYNGIINIRVGRPPKALYNN
jgi:hypothetical protein